MDADAVLGECEVAVQLGRVRGRVARVRGFRGKRGESNGLGRCRSGFADGEKQKARRRGDCVCMFVGVLCVTQTIRAREVVQLMGFDWSAPRQWGSRALRLISKRTVLRQKKGV